MPAKRKSRRRRLRGPVEIYTPPPLAPGDFWTYTCWCGTPVQGGRPALDDHMRVVHG